MGSRTLHPDTTAEAYLELLKDRGIDVFLGNAGTDFASLVEAFARFEAESGRGPRPLVEERRNSKRAFAVANPSPLPPAARHDRAPGGPSQAPPGGRARGDDPRRRSAGRRAGENSARGEKTPGTARARTTPGGRRRRAVRIRRAEGMLRTRASFGYVPRHGGERADSAEVDALTSPSRSSKTQTLAGRGARCHSRRRPGAASYDVRMDGRMFWFTRKKFVGSYVFFKATSRSYLSPYAARTRSSPSSPR